MAILSYRYATYFCLLVAIGVAASAAWTVYLPFKGGATTEWSTVLQTWGISRAIGWLGTATLVVVQLVESAVLVALQLGSPAFSGRSAGS